MADMSEAGRKSWDTRRKNEKKELRKWTTAQKKAEKKAKEAITFTKVKLTKLGWKNAEFKSKKGYPRTGIVDLVAVKIAKSEPDSIKLILFQVKGGTSRIKQEDRPRLSKAVRKVEIAFNCCEKPRKSVNFDWEPTEENFDLHVIR